jgi:hypothetical protein
VADGSGGFAVRTSRARLNCSYLLMAVVLVHLNSVAVLLEGVREAIALEVHLVQVVLPAPMLTEPLLTSVR